MRYNTLNNMWEEMLDDSDDVFIQSKSKRAALLMTRNGETFLLRGDFSGSPEECEAEARRIIGNSASKRTIRESDGSR